MLIDINAYVGRWPFMQFKYNTCETLVQRMDKFGMDMSIISNLNGVFYKNVQSANRELYEEIKASKRYRNRLIPFAVINPIYAGWQRGMETCVNKTGMRGIQLYPKYHDYDITHRELIALVKKARDMDIPIAFTYRMVDSRQRSWMDINSVPYTPNPEWTLKDILPSLKKFPGPDI